MNLLKSSRLMFYDTSEHPEQGCGSNGEEHVLSEREKQTEIIDNRTAPMIVEIPLYISRALSLSLSLYIYTCSRICMNISKNKKLNLDQN